MRALNRKLVEAEANEDGAAVRDDRLTSLEIKLLDMSSELVSCFAVKLAHKNEFHLFCRKRFVKKLQNLLHYNNKHLTMFYGLFSKLFLFPIICFCHLSTCDLLFTSSLCLSILTTHT